MLRMFSHKCLLLHSRARARPIDGALAHSFDMGCLLRLPLLRFYMIMHLAQCEQHSGHSAKAEYQDDDVVNNPIFILEEVGRDVSSDSDNQSGRCCDNVPN